MESYVSSLQKSSIEQNQEIVISDIKMTFSSMVVFMVKWAVATIPAAFILFFFFIVFASIFTAIFSR